MATYVFSKNGMGNYVAGTGMREDMHMQALNILSHQTGVILSTDLEVTETTVPSMAVKVSPGRVLVGNSDYIVNTPDNTRFWGVLAEETELAISSNTTGSTRYDLIVVQVNAIATPDGYGTNVATVEVVEGVAGSGMPATPPDSYLLGYLTITSPTTTQIVDANITDSRALAYLSLKNSIIPAGEGILADISEDQHTILYGGTNESGTPTGDGFRLKYDLSYGGGTGDYVVWEKTDHNQANPDGGFIWVLTGNDGVEEEALEIAGDGSIIVHDGNRLYMYDATDNEAIYFEMATNFSLVGSAGMGTFDIDFSAGGNAVRFLNGTAVIVYDVGNTNRSNIYQDTTLIIQAVATGITFQASTHVYNFVGSTNPFTITVGTNTELNVGTGNLHVFNASNDVHLRIYDNGGGSNYMDEYQSGNASVIHANGSSLNLQAVGNIAIAPDSDGGIIQLGRLPRDNSGSATYVNSHIQRGWGYIQGDSTNSLNANVTMPLAYSGKTYTVVISPIGYDSIGVPASEADANVPDSNTMCHTQISTSQTFRVDLIKASGTFTNTKYYMYSWIAIGPV